MRASELLAKMEDEGKVRFIAAKDEAAEDYSCSRVRIGDPIVYVPPHPMADVFRCLARLEAAVETLAEDAGSGPARRIKAILEGEEGT